MVTMIIMIIMMMITRVPLAILWQAITIMTGIVIINDDVDNHHDHDQVPAEQMHGGVHERSP